MEDIKEQLDHLSNWTQAHEVKDETRFAALDTANKLITNHMEHFSDDLKTNTRLTWWVINLIGLIFAAIIGDIVSKLI